MLMPAVTVVWADVPVFRNEAAKSLQHPQQVATPNWSCKSLIVAAPAATDSLMSRSVMALQMHTNM